MVGQRVLRAALICFLVMGAGNLSAAPPEEISIEVFDSPGELLRHRDGKGFITPIFTPQDARDARFRKVPGLAGRSGVSFESTNFPGLYLRHQSGRLIATKCPEPLDRKDATFLVVEGLAAARDGWISLQPLNFPGVFLQHRNGELWTEERDGGASFRTGATFRFVKPVAPRQPPARGPVTRATPPLDTAMRRYMQRVGCTAAQLAISRNGTLIVSRGYGWSDRRGTVPLQPNNPMAIGSCEKPITVAVVRQLARAGKFRLDDPILKVLKMKPHGTMVDDRQWRITIQHLIDHTSGWEGPPIDRAARAAAKKGFTDNVTERLLGLVMVQSLTDPPGAKKAYCNFGYDVLRLLIAKTTRQSQAEYVRHQLFKPHGAREIKEVQYPGQEVEGGPPQVWNARSFVYDNYPRPPASPLRASAPAMCTFLHRFWITGEPRTKDRRSYAFYGSTDNTTTVFAQRPDGIDFVCIFNGRADVTHDEIKKELDSLIDRLDKRP